MPKLICQNCLSEVRVDGIGAICPHCGHLVTVGQEDVANIDPVSAAETEFRPRPLPVEYVPPTHGPPSQVTKLVVLGGVAAVIIVFFVALMVVSARRLIPAPGPAAAPAVTALPARPVPAPQDRSSTPGPFEGSDPARGGATTQTAPPLPPPPPHYELIAVRAQRPASEAQVITDQQIGQAIERGVRFLHNQFNETRLRGANDHDPETYAGLNALAVYALLHSGQAIGDARFAMQGEFVKGTLERLKEYPMDGNRATYSRSLRISALTVFNRPEDRPAVQKDLEWLLAASRLGAYTYDMPPRERTRQEQHWDNSNSQYGALGVWAAAEAGFRVPPSYWNELEAHWTDTQTAVGGWGYSPGADFATLSMTAAGTNMLFVARDQLTRPTANATGYVPLSKELLRALEWLDDGDNAINLGGGHAGYTCYGLERAGLASGFKYFGKHDWYLELARQLIGSQGQDGSWQGGDGTLAETAFALLFLSRGRHPIFMTKLRFDGAWSNRPRDLHVFTRYGSKQLERPLNWQVAELDRNWWEWLDAPVMLITSNQAPTFSDEQIGKLRSFAEAGGLIFTNAEGRDPKPFDDFATELASRTFPQFKFESVPADHPVYSIVFPMPDKPPLQAVSNGVRLLMIHSPADLAGLWQPAPLARQEYASKLAINIAVYASGRRDLRNRLASPYVVAPQTTPAGVIPLARLKYESNWDPEPAAWDRMARVLHRNTNVAMRLVTTDVSALRYETAPIAHLTGIAPVAFSDAQISALRAFVSRGGVLLIDACGGSKPFADSIHSDLLPKLFPAAQEELLPTSHPILAGSGRPNEFDGTKDLGAPRLRPQTPAGTAVFRTIRSGRGHVIFTRLDLTNGLLGVNTDGILGYQPAWCEDFMQNLVFWTISQIAERTQGRTN